MPICGSERPTFARLEREDDREETVAIESDDARGEKSDDVAIHFLSAWISLFYAGSYF